MDEFTIWEMKDLINNVCSFSELTYPTRFLCTEFDEISSENYFLDYKMLEFHVSFLVLKRSTRRKDWYQSCASDRIWLLFCAYKLSFAETKIRGNLGRFKNVCFQLTSLFKKIKYIWIKIKAILVAGVSARRTLWHLVFLSNSKYCPNSKPEYIMLPIPKAEMENLNV